MRDLPLLLSVGIYFLSSLGGVSIVKFLNYHYCFTSWKVLALLSRSTWILSAILNVVLRYRLDVSLSTSRRQLCLYGIVAVGLSLVEVVNSFSMSVLPGSLYMLLKGSDVGWSMTLSYLLLKKRSCYSGTKMVAAALIMLGIGTVLVLDAMEGNYDNNNNIQSQSGQALLLQATGMSMTTASLLCLGGALLNSLCSVGTEAVLKKSLQQEQDRLLMRLELETTTQQPHSSSSDAPSFKLLLSNAYSMYTSLFSFGLLLPLSLFSGRNSDENEHRYLQSINNNTTTTTTTCPDMLLLSENKEDNTDDPSSSTMLLIAIGLCLAFLAISRFLERLCKHFICVYDSAVTFSTVQAARRWLGIYIVGWIFREEFANGMVVGSLISGAGFVLHGYDASRMAGSQQRDYKKLASNPFLADDSDASASEEIELPGQNVSA